MLFHVDMRFKQYLINEGLKKHFYNFEMGIYMIPVSDRPTKQIFLVIFILVLTNGKWTSFQFAFAAFFIRCCSNTARTY